MRKIKIFGIAMIAILLSGCSSDDGTVNTAPEIINLELSVSDISNQQQVILIGSVLTANYEYRDAENDPEGATLFNWYRADDQNGTNKEVVVGASESTYTLTSADSDKYISVDVTPVQSDGVQGTTISSDYSSLVYYKAYPWDEESITTYKVVDKEIMKIYDHPVSNDYLAYQQDMEVHQAIWQEVLKVVPPDMLYRIERFTIFYPNDNVAGYVSPIDDEIKAFTLGMSLEFYKNSNSSSITFEHIIAHELGHILTLNETQAEVSDLCPNYFNGYYCTKENSYLNNFYIEYWIPILDDYNTFLDPYDYYDLHTNEFVRWYAATNVIEDIADTFAYYVLNSDQFNESTVAGQKVLGLDDYVEFRKVKDFAEPNFSSRSSLKLNRSIGHSGFKCGTNRYIKK